MFEFSNLPDKSYVPKIDWAALDSETRGKVLQYLNYQIQSRSRSSNPNDFVSYDSQLWKEYEAGRDWTWANDRSASDAGRYFGFDVSAANALAQGLSHVPYGGDALAAVVLGAPILPVLAGEAIKAYGITTAGDQLIAKLTAPAAPAATALTSTTEAKTMETIASNAPVPTLWDQVSGIVSGGLVTATQNAVVKAISPAPTAPQYGQAGYTGFVSTGNNLNAPVLNIPVWGWLLAAALVGSALFIAAKK